MRIALVVILVALTGCKLERAQKALEERTVVIAEREGADWMMIGIKGTSRAASHGHAFEVMRFPTAKECADAANAFQGNNLDHGARCIAVAPIK